MIWVTRRRAVRRAAGPGDPGQPVAAETWRLIRASMPAMPRSRSGLTASVRPAAVGGRRAPPAPPRPDSPSSPSCRMPANPRVVGASRRGGEVQPHRRAARATASVDLDRQEDRRLALGDRLEQLGVVGVPRPAAPAVPGELEQQLQPVADSRAAKSSTISAARHGRSSGADRLARRRGRWSHRPRLGCPWRSAPAPRCPTRSTSRRSCGPCRSRAGGAARTRCGWTAPRSGSTRSRRRRGRRPLLAAGRWPRDRRGRLNVPSSVAARAHGTDCAPGMWPPRSAPSSG